jgi:hypothetical protein
LGTLVLPPPKEDEMQTVKLVADTQPKDLAPRIEDIATDVGMIYWACHALREAGLGHDEFKMALRVQQDLDKLLKEVRS